jgi:hypothetical protein
VGLEIAQEDAKQVVAAVLAWLVEALAFVLVLALVLLLEV